MRITSSIFDNTNCILGEGPFWHPLRLSLLWFDILNKKIFCKDPISDEIQCHEFTNFVSAAGWINYDQILVASESNLTLFDLKTKELQILIDLESSDFSTRSNDGRSDPWGGFWIGTMSKKAELEKLMQEQQVEVSKPKAKAKGKVTKSKKSKSKSKSA